MDALPHEKKPTIFKRRIYFQIFIVISAILFAILTFFARFIAYFEFDLTISKFIQSINFESFNLLMVVLSRIGDPDIGWSLIVLIFALLYLLKQKMNAYLFLLSSCGAIFLSNFFKILTQRPRPDPNLVTQYSQQFLTDSFPSGHVFFYIGVFGFLGFIIYSSFKKTFLRALLLFLTAVLVIAIGISRIYLGAHWASDVLGAYLIGIVWLFFIVHLHKKLNIS